MKNLSYVLFSIFIVSASFAEECRALHKKHSTVSRCQDNSISFFQPPGTRGFGKTENWNGLCGAVAAANVFHAYCDNQFIPPDYLGEKYFWEIINTPGIHPKTLKSGLNDLFYNNEECMKGEWTYFYTNTKKEFMSSIYKRVVYRKSLLELTLKGKKQTRAPLIALLSNDGGYILHYVTVVNVENVESFLKGDFSDQECKVTYNDNASQTKVTCEEFVSLAGQANDGWITQFAFHKFNFVAFEN